MAPTSLAKTLSKSSSFSDDRPVRDSARKASRKPHDLDHETGGKSTKRGHGKFRKDDRQRFQRIRNQAVQMKKSTSFWNLSLLYTVNETKQDAVHGYIAEMSKMVGDERISVDEALNAITAIRFNLLEFGEFKERFEGRLSVATFGFEKKHCEMRQQLAEEELRAHVLKVDEYLQSIRK